ncbi:hypothetical protein HYH03_002880 [Edaphochlamys debaryana]|uniref:Phosphoglycerate mutase n=1 Tax=Edaphochlamys debaryana TaxID=47281 RepID=A0A836C520_9CHLO|nr:hypothetical protein HYH03_002880 [Edaphochlamys debaryana]|eukprot:KAG2499302.1 hypothetical protein HYH03_002880 [Edaphochlamys debaryana]
MAPPEPREPRVGTATAAAAAASRGVAAAPGPGRDDAAVAAAPDSSPSASAIPPRPPPPPRVLVLLRHGESVWNLANRFTGWTDVELTEQGRRQATAAGCLLSAHGLPPDLCFTSRLVRAVRTAHLALEGVGRLHVDECKSWRLNERHYGALQGLNKAETAAKHGEEQVHIWRRSYATPPPPLDPADPRHPRHDPRYADLTPEQLPATESLKDCVARCLPYWHSTIAPALAAGRRPLVAAHGNSLRGIVKHLDGISDEDIMKLEIPTGTPLVYEMDEQLRPIRSYYIGAALLGRPPLDLTLLPPPAGPPEMERGVAAGEAAAGPALAEAAAEAPGQRALAALLQAMALTGATTPDHIHSAASAAALAGDLAEAEELLLRGALAAATFLFGPLTAAAAADAAAVMAEAPWAAAALEPAGPAELEVEGGAPAAVVLAAPPGSGKKAAAAAAALPPSGLFQLGCFRRAAPFLDAGRHVVVAVAAPEVAAAAAPEGPPPAALAEAAVAMLLAAMGVDKKVVLALPGRRRHRQLAGMGPGEGGTEGAGAAAAEGDEREGARAGLPAAWRGGGWVWGGGAAEAEETAVVADALSCATGGLWEVQQAGV